MRILSRKLTGLVLGALAAAAISAPMPSANAQSAQLWLACTPTQAAMDACVAKGGQFNTVRCRCVVPKKTAMPKPWLLVCVDGRLDAQKCRCVKD